MWVGACIHGLVTALAGMLDVVGSLVTGDGVLSRWAARTPGRLFTVRCWDLGIGVRDGAIALAVFSR